ncbi:hypothetical protein J4N45_11165 [Vibrio sp. SCSIO 43140]|uniref:Ig-like domain-containing protein n=1 Tax=Vibrio sp. SCSIO 43140 TaxID=2819100 RepID=UPI002075A16F|nr:Ig-like domain-containing protein [Vibrio sp. SCSIO 43140]USD59091.1 hypothetical protein J4N45_11165 [Vibrio sp. SCSIO 43140]
MTIHFPNPVPALTAVALAFGVSANAADLISLNSWKQYGDPASGTWAVSSDGYSVFQSINGHPTAFMSTTKYSYRTFRGGIQVKDGAGDDDYIGFVFGDPDSSFYLFDWKKGATGGGDGFTLLYYDGSLDAMKADGWAVHDRDVPNNTILGRKEGVGWVHGRTYNFELQIYPNRIVAKIDGDTIFDITDLEIEPSQFGFFNWSQGQVTYKSIEQLYPPIAEIKSATISQGNTVEVSGSWTDANTGDAHTCSISTQPPNGTVTMTPPCSFTYIPSPDHDGDQSFFYRVTDNSGLHTDAKIGMNVHALGAPFTLPQVVEADVETKVDLALLSSGNGFQVPSINATNLPSFMVLDRNRNELRINATTSDYGVHSDIEFFTTNGRASNKVGHFDLLVIPKNSPDALEQDRETLTTKNAIRLPDDTLVTAFAIPPVQTSDGNSATGPHRILVSSNYSNVADLRILDTVIKPGETQEVSINLLEAGTIVPIEYVSEHESTALLSIEVPWLNSPKDMRYVLQRACAPNDSQRCEPTLVMDRETAPEGEIQLIVRSFADANYVKLGFNIANWATSGAIEALSSLSQNDLVAININNDAPELAAMYDAMGAELGDNTLSATLKSIQDQGVMVYRVGHGIIAFETDTNYRWGSSNISWIDLNQ